MESPYYEMTHDFEEENRLFQSGYVKGYHDAVMKYSEMVRCKDCKYSRKTAIPYLQNKEKWCNRLEMNRPLDWFCADGKVVN